MSDFSQYGYREPILNSYRTASIDLTDYPLRVVAFPRNGAETNALVGHLRSANVLSYKNRYWYKEGDELTAQDKCVIADGRSACVRNGCPIHSTRILWMFYMTFVLFTIYMFFYVLKYMIHLEKIIDHHFKMEI